MRDFLLVGTGGFIGSVARYYISGLATQASAASRFPIGTLTVNVAGCLVIGILAGVAEQSSSFSPQLRLLLFTGLLGGFTTYSAFAYETYFLGREHAWNLVALNVGAQLVFGFVAVWIGHQSAVFLAK